MAETDVREVLTRGELTVKGRLPWSSNATFLVEAALEDATALGVYKPERGERPLWDFPPGLFRRELADWHFSEALGWGLVSFVCLQVGQQVSDSLVDDCRGNHQPHCPRLFELFQEIRKRSCSYRIFLRQFAYRFRRHVEHHAFVASLDQSPHHVGPHSS